MMHHHRAAVLGRDEFRFHFNAMELKLISIQVRRFQIESLCRAESFYRSQISNRQIFVPLKRGIERSDRCIRRLIA